MSRGTVAGALTRHGAEIIFITLDKIRKFCYNEIMDEKYLLEIANDCHNKFDKIISECSFFTVDDDCEIRYMSNSKLLRVLLCGPMSRKLNKDKNVSERNKLSPKSKNYYKLFYKNNVLLKVESYINGSPDHIYLCYYFDSLRILKPFSRDGGFYPAYTLITVYSNDRVVKEILLEGNQIITETYVYNNGSVEYEFADIVPDATKYKIRSYSKGIISDDLYYAETESFSWIEELRGKR